MPTPKSLISRAKSCLGWGADNEDKYEEWRELTQSYMRLHEIVGITNPGKQQFDAAVTAAINRKGVPDVGRKLLRSEAASKRVTEAKYLFRQLVSDCCKKVQETHKRRKIQQFSKNEAADAELEEDLPVWDLEREKDLPVGDSEREIDHAQRFSIRAALINTSIANDQLDVGPPSTYKWNKARVSHLFTLTNISLIGLHEAIKGRYRTDRFKVRAIYGILSKPAANGSCSADDIIRITSDQELKDFLIIGKANYSPLWLQIQLHRSDGTVDTTPPPDERPYFTADIFQHHDQKNDFYHAPEYDSDAATHFLSTGKRKKVAWPRADGRFEMAKYATRRRIKRLKKHLAKLKEKHRATVGPTKILYESDAPEYKWMLFLNPKTTDEWVSSRRAAKLGHQEKKAKMAEGMESDAAETVGEEKAISIWGKQPNELTVKDLEFDTD
ncbi:hypothetical protein EV426DRAFT_622692 [Tirmania nivea]|nr:hypothetical protein EV426DRAFT_622692 [Tirmania nivea]